jgi:hypothetical protein
MPVEVSDYRALLSGAYWTGFDTGPAFNPPLPPLPMGRSAFVTYSFPTAAPSAHANAMGPAFTSFQALTEAQKTQVRQALAEWGEASGLVFLEAPPGEGQMKFATYDFTGSVWDGAGGVAYWPFGNWYNASAPYFIDQGPAWDAAGDVFLNRDFFSGGLPDYGTLLHEIGHAIGLKHPWEDVFGHPEVLPPALDNTANTIMSYNGNAQTLGPLDIAAAQAIYGTDAQDGTQVLSWSWNAATAVLTQRGFATADVMLGVGTKDVMVGGHGNDRLFGYNGDDFLRGDGGNDELWGGHGNDTLRGGAGADAHYGGDGVDTVDYSETTGVVVAFDGSLAATGFAIGDTFSEVENLKGSLTGADRLRGSNGANTLTGGGGDDILEGQGGSDRLIGGAGNDTLTGGAGGDRFLFYFPNEGLDTITDFGAGDRLMIEGGAFGGLANGVLNAANFVAGSAANAAIAQVLYEQATGLLRFDSDGTGGAAAVAIAQLTVGTAIDANLILVF